MHARTPPVEPAVQKTAAVDPRLDRLTEKIKQVRHMRALRVQAPKKDAGDLH